MIASRAPRRPDPAGPASRGLALRLPAPRRASATLGLLLVGALVACGATGCPGSPPKEPAEKNAQAQQKADAEDAEVGRATDRALLQDAKLYTDPKLDAYVSSVLDRVLDESTKRRRSWTVRILDSANITVRSGPGGYIYLTRGLLAGLGSEAELAAALAHEAAHVERRHWRREPEFLVVHGIQDGDASKLSHTDRLKLLAQFREDEREADALAVESLKRARYSTEGLVRVLRLFDTIERMAGAQPLAASLRTHPETSSRLEALRASAGQGGELRASEYLAHVDGLLFGDDPRQGYLYGDLYVNPVADLELSLPTPWRSILLGHDLLAVFPGKASVVILSRSEQGNLEKTAAALGAGFTETELRGRRALSRRSAEEGGVVARMLILDTPAGAYVLAAIASPEDEHSPAIESILSGAKPISEPALKQIRALRVRVTKLDRAMTLRELQNQKPSRTNLDTLALLNGVGPDEKLAANAQVKRIDE